MRPVRVARIINRFIAIKPFVPDNTDMLLRFHLTWFSDVNKSRICVRILSCLLYRLKNIFFIKFYFQILKYFFVLFNKGFFLVMQILVFNVSGYSGDLRFRV
jgi:hypothetical protein